MSSYDWANPSFDYEAFQARFLELVGRDFTLAPPVPMVEYDWGVQAAPSYYDICRDHGGLAGRGPLRWAAGPDSVRTNESDDPEGDMLSFLEETASFEERCAKLLD